MEKKHSPRFKKYIYDLNNWNDSLQFQTWVNKNYKYPLSPEANPYLDSAKGGMGTKIYEDESFQAFQFCLGEFGGAIYFIEKGNDEYVYHMECTCAVMVERRNDGYYVIETLAHISGFGRIHRINTPKQLAKAKKDRFIDDWQNVTFPDANESQIGSFPGNLSQIILDTTGVTLSLFFEYNMSDYLIYSDFSNTYLGCVKKSRLEVIDTIAHFPSWRYNDQPNELLNNIHRYNYMNWDIQMDNGIKKGTINSGDIFVEEGTIVIGYRIDTIPKRSSE